MAATQGRGVAQLPRWKLNFFYVECFFSSLLGPFSPCGRPFISFFGDHFLHCGGGGEWSIFYVEIYLDLSQITKISAGVHAFAARVLVVPNILEYIDLDM